MRQLAGDPRVQAAARVGHTFGTNPLELLTLDRTDWAIVVACHNVICNDEAAAHKRERDAGR